LVETKGIEPFEGSSARSSQVDVPASRSADEASPSDPLLGVQLGVAVAGGDELRRIVSAWPSLSEPIRVAIVALVGAAQAAGQNLQSAIAWRP
jgi:hypothetical protein